MTIDETIERYTSNAEYERIHGDLQGYLGFKQLVKWLRDYKRLKEQEPKWIPVSKGFPEEDGDYYVTYEKGYAEDYDLPPIGIAGFEVDCESFGYWQEHFSITMGSLGSDWEEIPVTAWMPLPQPYKGEKA